MSSILLPQLRDNLERLKAHEDKIRTDSSILINSDEKLQGHINLIHESMDMLMWMHVRTVGLDLNESSIAIAGLKIRLFNSISCSLKLLLSGYYQGSISFIRDILEISFLLDYFTLDDSAIDRWSKDPNAQEFMPAKIRIALDKRDKLLEKKREQKYKLLSAPMPAHRISSGIKADAGR